MNSLLEEIRHYCVAHYSEENLIKYQRFFKEPYKGYGLTSSQVHQLVKEILKQKKYDKNAYFDLMPDLFASEKYEEISIGLLLLNGVSKSFNKGDFDKYGSFFELGVDNWAHADTIAMFTLPQFLLKNIVTPEEFAMWILSEKKFKRRCVPVTFIKYLKSGHSFEEVIQIVEPLMHDEAREVHQGMGWFLREAWKLEKEVVENFLRLYVNTSPRLIYQYACEKMSKEQKAEFRRKK